jgi:anti-sigma factor RsiW
MDCTKYHEIISFYVDEEVGTVEAEKLEKHIDACPVCKAELTNQLKIKDLINDSYQTSTDIDLSGRIMRQIDVSNTSKSGSMKKVSLFVAAVAAACVLAIAALMTLHVDNNTIADNGNEKLKEFNLEHADTGDRDFKGRLEAVNVEKKK